MPDPTTIVYIYLIASLFFVVALAYSSVGLGGGSAYTALMVTLGFSSLAIPTVSLTLNILVTTLGTFHFFRQGHARIRLILPFLVTSIPMAYLGGALDIPPRIFHLVLLVSLIFIALRIYSGKPLALEIRFSVRQKLLIALLSGALLGLVAGIAGIGGGIYLVPLILLLNLGTEKQAAACGAIFIWLNSMSGLIARMQFNSIDLYPYIPLFIAVLLGGWVGASLGANRLSRLTMERILGLIILIASLLLVIKLLG